MSVSAQISRSRCQSIEFRARRDTSRPSTMPARARLTSVTSRWKPSRSAAEAPDCPRSVSMTMTRSSGHPSATACLPKRILPLRALGVLEHLTQSGLPDVEISTPLEVAGFYLLMCIVSHRATSHCFSRSMPARMATISDRMPGGSSCGLSVAATGCVAATTAVHEETDFHPLAHSVIAGIGRIPVRDRRPAPEHGDPRRRTAARRNWCPRAMVSPSFFLPQQAPLNAARMDLNPEPLLNGFG